MPKPVKPERLDRHPGDGLPLNATEKRGGSGKFSWGTASNEEESPAAIDKRDPNYVDEDEEEEVEDAPEEEPVQIQ